MTDAVGAAGTPPKGWKKGLPQHGLKTAEDSARKLWDVARLTMTSVDAFANALGLKAPKGGSWDLRIALLRNYKLIKLEADQIGLSSLGQRLINDSDKVRQVQARREAMQALKAYKELIDAYAGTPLPEKAVLAGRLQYDYGKTPAAAEVAAQAFIDSLRHADMLTDHGVLSVDGRDGNLEPTVQEEDDLAGELDAAIEEAEAEEHGENADAAEASGCDLQTSTSETGRRGGAVSLNLSLDLSSFRADEVLEILRELGLTRRR